MAGAGKAAVFGPRSRAGWLLRFAGTIVLAQISDAPTAIDHNFGEIPGIKNRVGHTVVADCRQIRALYRRRNVRNGLLDAIRIGTRFRQFLSKEGGTWTHPRRTASTLMANDPVPPQRRLEGAGDFLLRERNRPMPQGRTKRPRCPRAGTVLRNDAPPFRLRVTETVRLHWLGSTPDRQCPEAKKSSNGLTRSNARQRSFAESPLRRTSQAHQDAQPPAIR